MSRVDLPYRKNCEIYVFVEDKVVAQKREGYLEFPGGGVDDGEDPGDAVARECFEETGVVVDKVNFLKKIYFDWSNEWAKTEKQRRRYEQYRGEEMHLFVGECKRIEKARGDGKESGWMGEVLLPISEAITFMERLKVARGCEEYAAFQLEMLKEKHAELISNS